MNVDSKAGERFAGEGKFLSANNFGELFHVQVMRDREEYLNWVA